MGEGIRRHCAWEPVVIVWVLVIPAVCEKVKGEWAEGLLEKGENLGI